MTEDLDAFIALAKGAEQPHCSSAEYGAGVLADDVLEHVFELDERALRGFVTFVGVAKVMPLRAREMLEVLE